MSRARQPGARSGAPAADGVGALMAALADPTRRAVVSMLAHGPQRAGELATALGMTPPTLSRHLRVLRHGGLITDDEPEHDARVRLYRLQPQALEPLQGWLDELQAFWGDQLLAFKMHAERKASTPASATVPASAPARRKPAPPSPPRRRGGGPR